MDAAHVFAGLRGLAAAVLMTQCEFPCLSCFACAVCFSVCSVLCASPANARMFIVAAVLKSFLACKDTFAAWP